MLEAVIFALATGAALVIIPIAALTIWAICGRFTDPGFAPRCSGKDVTCSGYSVNEGRCVIHAKDLLG